MDSIEFTPSGKTFTVVKTESIKTSARPFIIKPTGKNAYETEKYAVIRSGNPRKPFAVILKSDPNQVLGSHETLTQAQDHCDKAESAVWML